ncbi:MAG TPA: TRAP transporter large permease subunit, partial [Rhodopila sp.]|nr:TRAP transporter large permease subunit [Rhodopila sp.]
MAPASQDGPGVLRRLDRFVVHASEGIAAALVAAEVLLLLAGVIFRYVLDRPLIWSNELAGILFLWLVSLGAVIALNRAEHMRMTVVLNSMSPGARRFAICCSRAIVTVVTLVLLVPGFDYMQEQAAITTPTLQFPGSAEVIGQLVALAMLLYVALRQLFAGAKLADLVMVAALAIMLYAGLYWAEPLFDDIGNGALVVFFVGIAGGCILAGVPIAFAFGIATIAYLNFTSSIPLSIEINQIDQGMASVELLAVPMFIILGLLLEMAGIARALVDLLTALVGRFRGGLSYVLIFAIYLIAGISGSKAADQAAVAPVLLPEMKRRGVPPGELVAQLASAAAMSETIPPSLVLIIVGAVTGVSTEALFNGGLMPAAVAALGLIILIFFRSRGEAPHGDRVPSRETGRRFLVAIPSLILPFLIRYAVLAGVATATEVATIGVAYTVFVGVVLYRCFEWRRLYPVLVETASLSGAILLIIGSASAMAWALTQAGFAQTLTDLMTAIPGGKVGFMGVSILLFIVLGSVLEGLPSMVLFGPLLFPIAEQVGINVVQYALVSILAMGIGLFSPPFGVGFYQTCLISRASSDESLGRIWPYMVTLV